MQMYMGATNKTQSGRQRYIMMCDNLKFGHIGHSERSGKGFGSNGVV